MAQLTVDECFFEIRNGANIKQGVVDGGYPITRIETLSDDKFNRDRMGYAGISDAEQYKEYVLRDGDLLMSHINSPKYLGRTVMYRAQDREVIIHGMNLLKLKARRDIIEPSYAELLFYSPKVRAQIGRITKKSVNQASFSVSDLKKIKVELPSIEEQLKIVEKIDKLKGIMETQHQELEQLDLLIKARFVELFGDPITNPMSWEKKTLKDVCVKLTDGTHFSPESFEKGDYKYITAKNIKKTGFDFSNISYVNEDVHRGIYERCNPEYGDILYIKDGATTGIAMINTLKEEFTLLSSVALLKFDRELLTGEYLCSVLNNQAVYDDIRSNMGGAAITRLTIAKLNTIRVPIADINLQKHFSWFVRQVDKSKVAVQKSLDETQLLFDSLMQKYFG